MQHLAEHARARRAASLVAFADQFVQVRTTKLDTCAGPIDLSGPVEPGGQVSGKRPARNVCKAPVTGTQWVARGAFELRPDIVSNESWPEIATTGSVQPMVY